MSMSPPHTIAGEGEGWREDAVEENIATGKGHYRIRLRQTPQPLPPKSSPRALLLAAMKGDVAWVARAAVRGENPA